MAICKKCNFQMDNQGKNSSFINYELNVEFPIDKQHL